MRPTFASLSIAPSMKGCSLCIIYLSITTTAVTYPSIVKRFVHSISLLFELVVRYFICIPVLSKESAGEALYEKLTCN